MKNNQEFYKKVSLSRQADMLINNYACSSTLAGFIPVPLLDIAGLMSVQRIMLYHLSVLYGVPFKKHVAKALLSTLMGSVASSVAAPVAGSALKLIPGVGSLMGGAGMATLGSTSTYAIGKIFKKHFEKGGTLEDFHPDQMEQQLERELAESEKRASTACKIQNQ